MGRIEAEHQSIEKPATPARPLEKEPIHLRGQPHDTEPLAERGLGANGLAVDPNNPALARCAVLSGADMQLSAARSDDRGNGPARIAAVTPRRGTAIDFGQFGAAQPATRCQK